MDSEELQLIAKEISANLINQNFSPNDRGRDLVEFSNRNMMFEQYKLLVDSAHKIEDRRGGSNNIFIGINTILVSILVHLEQLAMVDTREMILVPVLTFVGVLIALDWLKVIASYKKLNSLNYSLIKSFENFLPTYVFSLRGQMEAERPNAQPGTRANLILISENLLPKVFLLTYSVYFVIVLTIFVRKFI